MNSPGEDISIAVVGGGPAGGFCAYLLSRAGFQVILYEGSEKVERKVCGEYLSPAASQIFERAGLPNFLSALFPPLDGIIFFTPLGLKIKTNFPSVAGSRYQGYALDRVLLEEELLRQCRAAGAEVRMGCKVRSVQRESEGWKITLDTGQEERSDLLIGADGRRSLVAKTLHLHRDRLTPRVALHCFLPGELPEPRYGQMHFFSDGAYLGLNSSPAGTVNFSLVCDISQIKKIGSPEAVVGHYLHASPRLKEILEWRMPIAVTTTYPLHHSVSRCFAHRAALIGDAAGIIDPLTGEGIYMALWTASCLAGQLTEMKANGGDDADHYLKKYAKIKNRSFRGKSRLSHLFQWVLKRPALVNLIAAYLGKKPDRSDAFIGIMGHLYTPAAGIKKILLGGK